MKKKLNYIPKLFLALGAIVALTSCDDIQAKPSDYNNNLVDVSGDALANNVEQLVYKQLHDSTTYGSDVANLVFKKVFEKRFGTLAEITAASKGDEAAHNTFADTHIGYQVLDAASKRLTDEASKKLERSNIDRIYKQMQKEIATGLFTNLNSSSNKIDDLYNEKLFAMDLYKDLYTIPGVSSVADFNNLAFYGNDTGILLTANQKLWDEESNDWVKTQGLLHLGLNGDANYYEDYINRKLLPAIEQKILTEQYLYGQSYSSFGRKYGREIEFISIPELLPVAGQVFNWGDTSKLCMAFAENLKDNDTTNDDFEILADAYRGIDIGDGLWAKAEALLTTAGFTKQNAPATDFEALSTAEEKDAFNNIQPYYYYGTIYGNNMHEFKKIKNKASKESTTAESKYSSNGNYSYFHGFELETHANKLKDYTNQGWALKSSTSFTLPDDIKTRLFNINVSIDYENVKAKTTTSKYLTTLGDGVYLTPEDTQRQDNYTYLWSISSTYYFVRVKEAASTTKLSKTSDGSYTKIKNDGGIYSDDVAYEIANLMSADSTTKTNALEYILENSSISYHDQDIYNYFKSTYPALFEN